MTDLPSLVLYVVFHRLFLRVTSSMVPGSCFINPFKASPQALPLCPRVCYGLYSHTLLFQSFSLLNLSEFFKGTGNFMIPGLQEGK